MLTRTLYNLEYGGLVARCARQSKAPLYCHLVLIGREEMQFFWALPHRLLNEGNLPSVVIGSGRFITGRVSSVAPTRS
jgi:hypothetical protein